MSFAEIEKCLGNETMTVLHTLNNDVTRQWEKINNSVPLSLCLKITLTDLHTLASEKGTDQCDKINCRIALNSLLLVGFYQKI